MHNSGFDSESAPILEQDTNITYGNRTVSFFLWLGVVVVAVVLFAGWQLRGAVQNEAEEAVNNPIEEVVDALVIGTPSIGSSSLDAGLQLEEAKAQAAASEVLIPVTNRDSIRMQQLKDARIFDFEGNKTGSVETLVYTDENNTNIYFEIDPAIAPGEGPRIYSVPYNDVVITKSQTGTYDIVLNRQQTAAVAQILLGQE